MNRCKVEINSQLNFIIGADDYKKRQEIIDSAMNLIADRAKTQSKILICTFNPLLKIQLNHFFRNKLVPKHHISVLSYSELFSSLLNIDPSSKTSFKKSLDIIASGIDLANIKKRFPDFTHVFFDQAEHILDSFPHFLEIFPEKSTCTISITCEDLDLINLSKVFSESFGENAVKICKSENISLDNVIIVDEIEDLMLNFKNFLSIPIVTNNPNDFRWSRSILLDFSNERYRRSISSNLEKMLYKNGYKNIWQYNSSTYPKIDYDVHIVTRSQSLGLDFKANLLIKNYDKSHTKEDHGFEAKKETIFVNQNNAFDIFVRHKVNYRFYFNGREIFIKDFNFDGNPNEWWIEAKMGVAEVRIIPFEITAEPIHQIKGK